MLKKLKNNFRDKPIQYILGLLGMLILVSISMIALGGSKKTEESNFLEEEAPITFRDLMVEDENQGDFLFDFEEEEAPKKQSETERYLDSIKRSRNNIPIEEKGVYSNENSARNLLIEKEIESIEAEKRKPAQRQSTAGTSHHKKKLSYEEKLKQAKAEMLADYNESNQEIEEYVEPIRFVAKVSPEKGKRVEYVLPGQQRRIRLTLEEDVMNNGKPYPLGTRIYAALSIREARILFNVSKIGSTPVELKSLDPRDELEGVYSERAGELWAEFENETINNSGSTAAQDFGREFGSPTVGNIATGLVRSLAKKNLSDSEKIPLDNTIKVIFSNE